MAGEVAICDQTVGVVDRSDLVKHELHGDPASIDAAVRELVGASPMPQAAAYDRGIWACEISPTRVLLLSDPCDQVQVGARIDSVKEHAAVHNASQRFGAIALVGPKAHELLDHTSVIEDGRLTYGEFREADLEGTHCWTLCESRVQFLLIVNAAQAAAAWRSLHDAGTEFHVGSVGHEAYEHFVISGRSAALRRVVG